MPATNTAAPVLTDSMIRDLAVTRPDLADDCTRALRGCRNTRNELAYKVGARVPYTPPSGRQGALTPAQAQRLLAAEYAPTRR